MYNSKSIFKHFLYVDPTEAPTKASCFSAKPCTNLILAMPPLHFSKTEQESVFFEFNYNPVIKNSLTNVRLIWSCNPMK